MLKRPQELSEANCHIFIMLDLWPPNSHYLKPIDYKICGIIQQRVHQTKVQDVNDLRLHLTDVWVRVEDSVIAIDQWRRRLHACIQPRRGHFKY